MYTGGKRSVPYTGRSDKGRIRGEYDKGPITGDNNSSNHILKERMTLIIHVYREKSDDTRITGDKKLSLLDDSF